jgi:futalosine hydrolase
MILVVSAVPQEIEWLGNRAETEVLVAGIGPVDAAARVTRALAGGKYEVVVNAGIAGAMRGVAKIGDGVVVGEELMEFNLETGEPLSLPHGVPIVERVSADPQLCDAVEALGFHLVRGMTVTRVTSTDATAARLHARGAQVESMEGFAVLRAAQLAGVPAIEVRGISNYVGDRSTSEWDFTAGITGLRRILNSTLDVLFPIQTNDD